jgi:hypothetical protein
MTMQHHDHPQDERLAALAGNDPEAVADRALTEHVHGCARCGQLLGELQSLRAVLADLPDLAPSRRLQLLPPVPAPAPRAGWLGRLRGFAAPVMVAGAGLALVGAVGLGGFAVSSAGLTGGAAAPEALSGGQDRNTDSGDQSSAPAAYGGESPTVASASPEATATPQPVTNDEAGGQQRFLLTDTSTPAPWLALIVGGGILLGGGLVLRYSVQPRAG